jgi:hypothetical protein
MKKFILSVAVTAVVMLVAGCPGPGSAPGSRSSTPPGGGALAMNLPLLPLLPSSVKKRDFGLPQSYDISGAGPLSASFQSTGVRDDVTIGGLAPGPWNITVYARDAAGHQLGAANPQATVLEGETVAVDVSIDITAATGTLALQMAWPQSRGISPTRVSLVPVSGTPLDVTLPPVTTAGGVSSVSSSTAAVPGCYALTRVFSDGTGGVDAIAIASGASTAFALSVVTDVSVSISPDISKTIPLVFSGKKSNLGRGASMTVTATPHPSKEFNSFAFQWYLNGVPLADGTAGSVTINGSDYPGGTYRLDAVVASQGVLSSDGVFFTIAGQ